MPSEIRIELPAHAAERLLEGWRSRDPKLISMFLEFGRLLAIGGEDEQTLATWENEGGTCL